MYRLYQMIDMPIMTLMPAEIKESVMEQKLDKQF